MNICENKFFMTVCGDLTIKFYENQMFKEKKIGRVSFNTAFLPKSESSFKFKIDEIDPDSLQSDKNYDPEFEVTVRK